MKYFIYVIKAGITALSENTESQIKMTVRTSNTINAEDRIIGFCENPISEYRYIFNGLSMSNGKITLAKILQILNGVKSNSLLPSLEAKIKEEIVSGNDLIEITEEQYKEIEKAIINRIGVTLHKNVEEQISNSIPFSRNRIVFGAPGTGKSHNLNKDCKKYFNYKGDIEAALIEEIKNRPDDKDKQPYFSYLGIKYAPYINKMIEQKTDDELKELWNVDDNAFSKMKRPAQACIEYGLLPNNTIGNDDKLLYERVTFHPNYSYAQFIGTYKPITKTIKDNEEISYEYVPGPFIRTYIKAKKSTQNVLLLIEEINRANVAAVFGDIFQLLDRDANGNSEYPITTSEDLRKFLAKPENLGGNPENYKTLSIPSNMYIWATMNSADQGVLPMDAAFKRRWEFEYINIDEGAADLGGVTIPIPNGKKKEGDKEITNYVSIEWNKLRTALNDQLKKVSGVNEDKLLGPFFIGDKAKIENAAKEPEQFCKSFKSKVLMYLFEDVVKMQPGELFDSKEGINIHYSDICKDYDSKGLRVFVKSVYEQFPEFANGDSE